MINDTDYGLWLVTNVEDGNFVRVLEGDYAAIVDWYVRCHEADNFNFELLPEVEYLGKIGDMSPDQWPFTDNIHADYAWHEIVAKRKKDPRFKDCRDHHLVPDEVMGSTFKKPMVEGTTWTSRNNPAAISWVTYKDRRWQNCDKNGNLIDSTGRQIS